MQLKRHALRIKLLNVVFHRQKIPNLYIENTRICLFGLKRNNQIIVTRLGDP